MTFIRRVSRSHFPIRTTVQTAFLLINLWLGATFFLWVRAHEAGVVPGVQRPGGIEGWLPIAGLMGAWAWWQEGRPPAVHPAAAILFVVFLAASWLFRKAFCSWLCPIGTLSERLWKFGRRNFRRNWYPPHWLDLGLRAPKYLVLAFFLWAICPMDAADINAFLGSPYGLAADVRMLEFFRHLSGTAAVVIGIFALGSVFIPNFWCKYFCPYGALMGLAALASPLRVTRTPAACIDCGKCARVCPSHLAVDQLVQIRSAECLGCLDCVAACPVEGALDISAPGHRLVQPRWIAAALTVLFFGAYGTARWLGYWDSPIPDAQYRELIQRASELAHP